jgi:hypothetical protein
LHGADSTFAGLITGVADLYVEDATDIEFHSTANTALIENGTYFNVKDEGNFAWDTFTVKKGGIVGFLKITKAMHIWNSETRVKYFGNLYMNDAIIDSSYAWIESVVNILTLPPLPPPLFPDTPLSPCKANNPLSSIL